MQLVNEVEIDSVQLAKFAGTLINFKALKIWFTLKLVSLSAKRRLVGNNLLK